MRPLGYYHRPIVRAILEAIFEPSFKPIVPKLQETTWGKILSRTPEVRAENERLEFVGDAVFSACLALALKKTIPSGTPFMYTVLRSALTCNVTFCHLVDKIDLSSIRWMLNSARSFFGEGPFTSQCLFFRFRTKREVKTAADAFEVIVAAIHEERGFPGVSDWIKEVFEPLLQRALTVFKEVDRQWLAAHPARQVGPNLQFRRHLTDRIAVSVHARALREQRRHSSPYLASRYSDRKARHPEYQRKRLGERITDTTEATDRSKRPDDPMDVDTTNAANVVVSNTKVGNESASGPSRDTQRVNDASRITAWRSTVPAVNLGNNVSQSHPPRKQLADRITDPSQKHLVDRRPEDNVSATDSGYRTGYCSDSGGNADANRPRHRRPLDERISGCSKDDATYRPPNRGESGARGSKSDWNDEAYHSKPGRKDLAERLSDSFKGTYDYRTRDDTHVRSSTHRTQTDSQQHQRGGETSTSSKPRYGRPCTADFLAKLSQGTGPVQRPSDNLSTCAACSEDTVDLSSNISTSGSTTRDEAEVDALLRGLRFRALDTLKSRNLGGSKECLLKTACSREVGAESKNPDNGCETRSRPSDESIQYSSTSSTRLPVAEFPSCRGYTGNSVPADSYQNELRPSSRHAIEQPTSSTVTIYARETDVLRRSSRNWAEHVRKITDSSGQRYDCPSRTYEPPATTGLSSQLPTVAAHYDATNAGRPSLYYELTSSSGTREDPICIDLND